MQISGDNTEKIEFPVQGDKILAATIYNQIPLFFTRIHGLVSLSASDFDNSEFFNKWVSLLHLCNLTPNNVFRFSPFQTAHWPLKRMTPHFWVKHCKLRPIMQCIWPCTTSIRMKFTIWMTLWAKSKQHSYIIWRSSHRSARLFLMNYSLTKNSMSTMNWIT